MEKFKITLSDGTQLKDLEMNGNNYISKKKVTESTFAGKLDHISVEDGSGNVTEYDNMALVQIARYDGDDRYWIAFKQMSDLEIRLARFEAFMEAQNVK